MKFNNYFSKVNTWLNSVLFSKSNTFLLIVLFFISFTFLSLVRSQVNHFNTGDEPHYLLINKSISEDNDLNLKNQYTEKQYYKWYPEYISPHVGRIENIENKNEWYSFHGIGLSVVLAPFYEIGEKQAIVIALNLLASLVVCLAFYWTFLAIKNKRLAFISSGILLLCYFFNGLAGYIYPDLLISLLMLCSLIFYNRYSELNNYTRVIFGLLLGSLVFVHFKTLFFIGPLLLLLTYKEWKLNREIPFKLLIPTLFVVLLFFVILYIQFGVLVPSSIYSSTVKLTTSPLMTVPAMLVDRTRGLLTYNPSIVLIFAGLPLWYRFNKKIFIDVSLIIVPSLLLLSTFNEWQGGYSPNGRYTITFIPLLLPGIAYFFKYVTNKLLRYTGIALVMLSAIITYISIVIKAPYTSSSTASPIYTKIEDILWGLPISKFFPSYTVINKFNDSNELLKTLLMLAIIFTFILFTNKSVKGSHSSSK
jgi:hypothetical protein